MQRGHGFILASVLLLTQCLWGAQLADASTVYNYTGNDFTGVFGSYTGNDNLTLSVTLSSSLGDDFSNTVIPVSFTASDGVFTYTGSSTGSYASSFYFQTGNSGQITSWYIYFQMPVQIGSTSGYEVVFTSPGGDTTNFCSSAFSPGGSTSGCETAAVYSSGTWTTPLPAALPLYATGLILMGLYGWRRKRKAQAVA
jgi:hypothetical protein